jgi:hypothetical protein
MASMASSPSSNSDSEDSGDSSEEENGQQEHQVSPGTAARGTGTCRDNKAALRTQGVHKKRKRVGNDMSLGKQQTLSAGERWGDM